MSREDQLQFTGMQQSVEEGLFIAQRRAEQLFQLVVDEGLIRAGRLESELSAQIYTIAKERFGARLSGRNGRDRWRGRAGQRRPRRAGPALRVRLCVSKGFA